MTSAALTVLTLGGHAAGAGTVPSAVGLAMACGVSFALTYAVSDRRRGRIWLLAYLLGGQVLLHTLLSFTADHQHGGAQLPSPAMLAGHALAAIVATLLLAHADDLLERWLLLLSHALGAPRLGEGPDRAPADARPRHRARAGLLCALLHHVERRGPPPSFARLVSP